MDAKGATLYRYNGKNQLIEEENSDGKNQFTYDRQGGIVEEENSAGIRLFSYNSRHQQTKVETESGNVQNNRYDAEGLRFELLENGRRTSFVYHNGELLHEEGGNEKQSSYHLGAGIDALQRGKELSYYHRDEQLSTAFITAAHGEIQSSYLYDAFGAELETNEQFLNRIRYTGQQYDGLAEQYYLRVRYYNPVLGRFMQEDVYQSDGLNPYAYCHNNPVVYYDLSGYAKKKCSVESTSDGAKEDHEPYDIVDYGDKTPGTENHHGILDVWSKNNIDGYKSRASDTPTIALTPEQHAATKEVYREWLYELTGRKVGGKVDWQNISAREILSLSEKMFDAAEVPESARNEYYSKLTSYIYNLLIKE